MGHVTAWFGLPINGLDNFEAPRAAEDWNGFPVPLVGYDYAKQIAEAVGDPIPEPYTGLRPYDGLQWEIIDELLCRYGDCDEQHPVIVADEQVTCPTCREALGLPKLEAAQ